MPPTAALGHVWRWGCEGSEGKYDHRGLSWAAGALLFRRPDFQETQPSQHLPWVPGRDTKAVTKSLHRPEPNRATVSTSPFSSFTTRPSAVPEHYICLRQEGVRVLLRLGLRTMLSPLTTRGGQSVLGLQRVKWQFWKWKQVVSGTKALTHAAITP